MTTTFLSRDNDDIPKLDFDITTYKARGILFRKEFLLDEENFDIKNRKLNFGVFNNISKENEAKDEDFIAREYEDGFLTVDYKIKYYQTGIAVLTYFCETDQLCGNSLDTTTHWYKKFCFVYNFNKKKWNYVDWNLKRNPLCQEYKIRKTQEKIMLEYYMKGEESSEKVFDFMMQIRDKKYHMENEIDEVLKEFLLLNNDFFVCFESACYYQTIKIKHMKYLNKFILKLNNSIIESLILKNYEMKKECIKKIKEFFVPRELKISKNDLLLGYSPTKEFITEIDFLIPSMGQIFASLMFTDEYWSSFLEEQLEKGLTEIIFNKKPLEKMNSNFFIK